MGQTEGKRLTQDSSFQVTMMIRSNGKQRFKSHESDKDECLGSRAEAGNNGKQSGEPG